MYRVGAQSPRLPLILSALADDLAGDGLAIATTSGWRRTHVEVLSFSQVGTVWQRADLQAKAGDKPQTNLIKFLKTLRGPTRPVAAFKARVCQWLSDVEVDDIASMVSRLRGVRNLGLHSLVYNTIRTAARGWCTSHRFRGRRCGSCVFGCTDNDHYPHYMSCPRLWSKSFLRSISFMNLELDPTRRWAQLSFLHPRPSRHGLMKEWDLIAASISKPCIFSFGL